ncbi:hypothetical protein KBY57_13005 [Cyanobium sp. Aljojuca 7D2]|uniref:hypothetical protein n=1 Tax=Cyanobium sp. Aljojuca 7D2 TaxID=2823698 RepID=UPI0020CB931C|nr:hypothetical protein [Cyanobium sp. Aljojuca 7D2]MCP9891964.1 hypothetical protein [Cyanobium sp. Aljojuca 7D2]
MINLQPMLANRQVEMGKHSSLLLRKTRVSGGPGEGMDFNLHNDNLINWICPQRTDSVAGVANLDWQVHGD